MQKQPDIESLEPAPIEAPLVAAMREHREEWPYIYVEMKKVCKDDLLLDAEYCNRHKHPSMTQFFRECASIGGVNISQMRKYQRAGGFYEAHAEKSGDFPPVTDERVCALSPETFVILARIDELVAAAGPGNAEAREGLMCTLIGDLLAGRGLPRRELRAWLSSLRDAAGAGKLSECVDAFFAELSAKKVTSPQAYSAAVRASRIESQIRPLLKGGSWLERRLGDRAAFRGRIDLFYECPLKAGEGSPAADFVVLENVTCGMATHAIEIKAPAAHGASVRASAMPAGGFDYSWVVLATDSGARAADLDLGSLDGRIGVMEYRSGELRAIRPAQRLDSGDAERAALYCELLSRILQRSSGTAERYEYCFVTT